MRRRSLKRRKRDDAAKLVRDAMVKRFGHCMVCDAFPGRRNGRMAKMNRLCVHEIANGPLRSIAQDKPFACLVLCWHCNSQMVKGVWPESRQLAVLKVRDQQSYDLVAYNRLVNERAPDRITQAEVDEWIEGGQLFDNIGDIV